MPKCGCEKTTDPHFFFFFFLNQGPTSPLQHNFACTQKSKAGHFYQGLYQMHSKCGYGQHATRLKEMLTKKNLHVNSARLKTTTAHHSCVDESQLSEELQLATQLSLLNRCPRQDLSC